MDTNEELVRQAMQGNHSAFITLHRKYRPTIVAICKRMLHNDADSEDAAQEVFIKAWSRVGTLNAESQFGVWLSRIAANSCINMIRKRNGKISTEPFSTADLEEQADAGGIEDEVLQDLNDTELLDRVYYHAKGRWDADDFFIFDQRFEQDETNLRIIADEIGMKIGKVRYRINAHIMPVLQTALKEHEEEISSG